MQNYGEQIPDPVFLAFDVSGEEEYVRDIILKLRDFELMKPEKKYAAIFYERYVQNLPTSTIAKIHNTTVEEIHTRIMEFSKAVCREEARRKRF